jgi:cell division transport system permease protein
MNPRESAAPRRAAPARWWRAHRWALGQSLLRLRERPLGTVLTMVVMGLSLALPLSFYLVQINLERFGQALGAQQALNVFLRQDQGRTQAEALARSLRADPVVAAVTLKSPAAGLSELAALQGFGPALAALPDNPLPWVLVLRPRAVAASAAVSALATRLRGNDAVALVQDQGPFRARLDALTDFGQRVMQVLGALLALAAVLVVGASVRSDIQSRTDEIHVLHLVGASAAFIRRPYLYAGFWLGLLSGVVAVIVVLLLELVLAAPAARLDASWGGRLHFAALDATPLLVLLVCAAMLGWLGARMASARHLAAVEPN